MSRLVGSHRHSVTARAAPLPWPVVHVGRLPDGVAVLAVLPLSRKFRCERLTLGLTTGVGLGARKGRSPRNSGEDKARLARCAGQFAPRPFSFNREPWASADVTS